MKKRKLWIILPVAAALLVCIVLVLYAYTPVFVPDEPLAEFPACLQQATSVKFTYINYAADETKVVKNRFKIQSMAKRIAEGMSDETQFTDPDYDGGYYFEIEFYRGDEYICSLNWHEGSVNDWRSYRIKWKDESSEQWYLWEDPELMRELVEDMQYQYARKSGKSVLKTSLEYYDYFWEETD